MSAHSVNLRSENPALLVEFSLPPGTHARIGASSDAEISLPLAGLAEFACLIECAEDDCIFISDPDGSNARRVHLPAALLLSPYQFVLFRPVAPSPITPSAIGRSGSRKLVPFAGVALAVMTLAAFFALDRNRSARTDTMPPATVKSLEAGAAVGKKTPSSEDQPTIANAAKELASPPAATAPAEASPPPVPKLDLEALAERIAPAVFRLEVKDANGDIIGTGTAFAISADGLAVTNFHVVENGRIFTARTTQGAEFAVSQVSAVDPAADLALVTLKATDLPFLELGESDSVKIGAPVAVYGSPQGFNGTLSEGILSARRVEPVIDGKKMPNGGRLLQITAPISPGSSGSPVIDRTGKVIGVAAVGSVSAEFQSLNFILPVELVANLRKNSLAGIADTFSPTSQQAATTTPAKPEKEASPEAAFQADRDFAMLERHFKSSNWIECVKVARPMAARHPQASSARVYLGVALSGIGLNEQAEQTFKEGLAISPDSWLLWQFLGVAQLAQNRTLDARESWKRAAGLSPESSDPWRRLAISYLQSAEYLDAIAALENLRKLDRPEFDRLIGLSRGLYVHPPDLQSMLYHFDSMDEATAGAPLPLPTNPEDLAADLVSVFLRHGQEDEIAVELADYAPVVDPYFDQGRMTKAAILKDITTYRRQWPRRTLRLLNIELARRDDIDTLEATYRLSYTASDGKTNRSGKLIQWIHWTHQGGRWVVSGVQTTKRLSK
jgi:S1-C subfamily serine protease